MAAWMGMPESQAQAQGQYAYDSVEVELEDEAMYEQAAYQEGYQRFMDTMAANQVAKEQKMASFEAMKRSQDLKRREERETQRLTDERMKKIIVEKRAAAEKDTLAEKKALLAEKKAMEKKKMMAAKLAEEKRAEEVAFKTEIKKMELEQAMREEKMADAKARGKKRAIAELEAKETEEQAYKKQMEEMRAEMERKAQKEAQERAEHEALQEMRAERIERQRQEAEAKRKQEELRAKEAAEAKRNREAEYAKMMAEYQKKETVEVTDDGEKDEKVEVSATKPLAVPTAPKAEPMVTVTSDEGLTHSYPQRDFKPEQPKKEETVTLKTSGEIHDGTGKVADKAVLVGLGLAMTASMVLMMTRKFRSPIAAPEVGVALTSMESADLEDPAPIASEEQLAESWASSAVEKALAAADAKA
jgi:hypothetical protein